MAAVQTCEIKGVHDEQFRCLFYVAVCNGTAVAEGTIRKTWRKNMKTIIKILSARLRIACLTIIFVAVICAFLASLLPGTLGRIIDGFTVGTEDILSLIAFYTILFISVETLVILRRVTTHRLTAQFSESIYNSSLSILIRLPKYILEKSGASGELTSKVNQAVSGASQLLMLMTNDVVPTLFLAVFTIMQCMRNSSPIFAFIMLGYIMVSFGISFAQIKSQKGIREKIIDLKTQFDGEVCQSINGIEQIRALGAEKAECQRLAPHTEAIRRKESYHHTAMGIYDQIKQIVKTIFFIAICLIGFYCIKSEQLTSGQIITVVLLFQQLIKPIDDIYRFLDEISASSIKLKTLKDLMAMDLDPIFLISDKEQITEAGNIAISQYKVLLPLPGGEKILSQGNTITFEPGKSTAIVGANGCGKSSLFKGLMRIYPATGLFEIAGVDVSKISQSTLTRILHYIPQEPFFFAGTIKANLAYGLEKVSDSDMLAALKLVCLDRFGENSPLHYLLQEGGRPLSGGELKRLAIARAFLRSPSFYLMDEVFAGVDSEMTRRILDNLKEHAQKINAGIIHITHDENIKARCDQTIDLTLSR